MKETWNVVIVLDGYAGSGFEEVIIGDPKEVKEYCENYAKEQCCDCWIVESFEVERD